MLVNNKWVWGHGFLKVENSLTRMPQIGEWREQSHKKFVKFANSGNSRLKDSKLSSDNEKAIYSCQGFLLF